MSFNKYLPKLHNFLAFVVLIIAVIVMLGWILQNPTAIRISPKFSPMAFNTAFLLCFLSIGVLFSDRDYFKIGRSCAVFVMAFATFVFSQYPLGTNWGIDSYFVTYFIDPSGPHPGRMAASTCIALFLLGLGVFFNKSSLLCQFIRVSCAATVCCVGLVGAAGYIFDINSQYGWGSFARMALHTSICVIVLAIALMLQLWERMGRLGAHRRIFVPFYVLTAGIFITVALMQLLFIND